MSDRVVIVTGAGSGIGQATALVFAAARDRIVVADHDTEAARATADELRLVGSEALAVTLDVSDRNQVRWLVSATIEALGRLDVLVNNTGFGVAADVVETTEADLDRIFGVNVNGVFCGCQEAIPAMLQGGGGVIVNVSSVAALAAVERRAAYRVEVRGDRTNAVHRDRLHTPGHPLQLHCSGDGRFALDHTDRRRAAGPGRGTREDGRAPPEADFVHGSCLVIDGGFSAR